MKLLLLLNNDDFTSLIKETVLRGFLLCYRMYLLSQLDYMNENMNEKDKDEDILSSTGDELSKDHICFLLAPLQ
jgi:hypothetical protein